MDEKKRKGIGERIRLARETLGLKQSIIAGELGISRSQVNYIETGASIPAYLLDWLSDQKVSLDWIFRGIGEMFLFSGSRETPLSKPQSEDEEDLQQMLEDFEKSPELKHRMLSDYFMIRNSYVRSNF